MFEDVRLEEVYLGITIDCDYETHGTVVPNIGVLATNVTYRNVTGTVVAPRPRSLAARETRRTGASESESEVERESESESERGDPSMKVNSAGTFICRDSRPCDFSMDDVHITHADASNTSEPQWLCNNSLLGAPPAAVSPSLPSDCRHRK